MAKEDKYADEVMSDEELDNVAGGGTMQTTGDGDFLESHGFISGGERDFLFNWEEDSAKVDAGWAKAGVTCVTKYGCPDNLYFINGKQVSRKDAFRHALRQDNYSESEISNYNFDQWAGSFD